MSGPNHSSNSSSSFALELKDLRKSFGKSEIIRGINLAIPSGERVGIIGPNGAGKSRLMPRMISDLPKLLRRSFNSNAKLELLLELWLGPDRKSVV